MEEGKGLDRHDLCPPYSLPVLNMSASAETKKGVDPAQMALYREAFNAFDKNRDGRISSRELASVMQNMGESPSKKELKEMIKSIDGDGSGKIDFEEFVRMMENRAAQRMGDSELKEMFKAFDKNGDGIISMDELRIAMESLGEDVSDSDLRKMVRQADTNKDGSIDFSEFRRLLQSLGM